MHMQQPFWACCSDWSHPWGSLMVFHQQHCAVCPYLKVLRLDCWPYDERLHHHLWQQITTQHSTAQPTSEGTSTQQGCSILPQLSIPPLDPWAELGVAACNIDTGRGQ